MSIALSGPELAVQTCARRLVPLRLAGGDTDGLSVDVSWYGPTDARGRRGSEAAVQALSGLMQVHGRDAGGPRRIGLEVASVAAGVLAAHAGLAAVIGRRRGLDAPTVRTSVLQAGLLLVSHRVAADTSGGSWVPAPPGPAPGPPFHSRDGRWFEIETMDASAWRSFWERMGAGDADLARAWALFRPRYFRGTCTLPPGLHEAAAAHTLSEADAIAHGCGVSLAPVRSYREVLDEPGWSEGHASVSPLPPVPPAAASPGTRATASPASPGHLPLEGLRVVEASSRLQGPLAGLLLQMLGAHVVRVEPPGGDLGRTVPPLLDGTGSFYRCFNRGKEPVELDLGRPEGRAELIELLAGADVFLQNWKPGKADEWGLDARNLATVNPRLIYAHASGWGGAAGPAHLLGTDFLVQAYAGVACGINPEGDPPLPSRALLTDYFGALNTCEAILAALYLRERDGRGQRTAPSLLGGAMALQAHVLEALVSGQEKGRRDGRPLWSPLDRPLPTVDGTLVVSVEDDDDLRRLCRICGIGSSRRRDGLEARLAARISEEPAAHWEDRLIAAGLPCAAVCTDLAALPAEPALARLFEPLAAGASVPAAPWTWS